MTALARSVWPFASAWNAVLRRLSMPSRVQPRCQNPAANCGPLSDTLLSGKPKSRNTCSMNRLAKPAASMFVQQGTTWRALVRRSITTQIASLPWDHGRPATKSMAMSS